MVLAAEKILENEIGYEEGEVLYKGRNKEDNTV
ncbi:MAG: hypothetical protein JG777_1903 [Clostridia bacterium]|jgi:hypothetical protein|nr:hypothetical protein [Clostridia bacterium]